MRSISRDERRLLRGFEKMSVPFAELMNRSPFKQAGHAFLTTVGQSWVYYASRNLQRIEGAHHTRAIDAERGVMLVSNHLSFFDMYMLSCILIDQTSWVQRMYFPVRSSFFYEQPLGIFVNTVMAAMSMYPPVLRSKERRAFNRYVVDFTADELRRPGTLVGFHPEGTRNKTGDNYTLLPAQPGVGEIAHRSRPTIIPAFICGLSNNFARQVKSNFDGTGTPIDIEFGAPVQLDDLYALPPSAETHQAIANRLRDTITGIGQRVQLRRGEADRILAARDAANG